MKEKLFFRATLSISENTEFCSIFSLLMMLPLLGMPLFFNATALKINIPQQSQEGIIYIVENAFIYGIEESTNAKVVKIEAASKSSTCKKVSESKIRKQTTIAKKVTKTDHTDPPKLAKPKFLFKNGRSNESLDSCILPNNRNSVITPVFISLHIVLSQDAELYVPVFVYLMNFYTVYFAKTAALSQFLFSRPPPFSLERILFS
ncbi:hypothetical protein [Chryseobacterium sp. R2A-55]|uniref:hypothetical protein n=1 Tax=Chryseobacterium sp. R2A-55 TaxID=2744445 RepID=UPI001F313775|nr:hypothetical protein [Chryseobacterium sp. R2A-55]